MARRQDLVDRIAMRTDYRKNQIDKILVTAFDEIQKGLSKNEIFDLRRFGTFSTRLRKAKYTRVISTNELIRIEPTIVPHFRPSATFKKAVNNKS